MTIINAQETSLRNGLVISNMTLMGHEQVVFCQDSKTGLKSIIKAAFKVYSSFLFM